MARTLSFSLTALIFYVPANMFPFLTMEIYGNRNSATIWDGVEALMHSGSWTVAIIVFLASILIPFLKLAILFYLAVTVTTEKNNSFKMQLHTIVDNIGRWSMLDIFLLAIMVSVMKLGTWTSVEPEVGSLFFALVVIFTMLASWSWGRQQ
jgi:paraquat-inducible protein A